MDDKNFEVCDISKMNLSVNMVTLMILRYIRLGIIYFYKYRNIELWAVYNPVHISMIPNFSSTVNMLYDENFRIYRSQQMFSIC